MTNFVCNQLSELLQGEVQIKHLEIGFLNRLILNDVSVKSPSGEEVLSAAKLSAKIDLLPLLQNEITFQSIQLFGLRLHLTEERPGEGANYQFLVDALASNDTTSTAIPSLRINALLIRQGQISYDVLSEPETPGQFNTHHLHVKNFRTNISLKTLTEDSLHVTLRQLSFYEHSGLQLNNLSLKLMANQQQATLSRFSLEMPQTLVELDTVRLSYTGWGSDSLRLTHFQGGTSNAYITPEDLKAVVPALSNFQERIHLRTRVQGDRKEVDLQQLTLFTDHKELLIESNGLLLLPADSTEELQLSPLQAHLEITTSGMHLLQRNLSKDEESEPSPLFARLGNTQLNLRAAGPLNHLLSQVTLQTLPGTLEAQLTIDRRTANTVYSGTLVSNQLHLNQLLDDDRWGDTSFNLAVDGTMGADHYPDGKVKGEIALLEYNGYPYQHILLDGVSKQGGYDGSLLMDDPNGHIAINGSMNTAIPVPECNLVASVKEFRPHNLHLSEEYKDTDFSLVLKANFHGNNADNIEGEITLDSLLMIAPTDYYFLEQLQIRAGHQGDQRHITLQSDFLNGSIDGDIHFATLGQSLSKVLHPYVPSLVESPDRVRQITAQTSNNLTFDLQIKDLNAANKIFNFPLELTAASTIKGYLNDRVGKIRVEGYFPHFSYAGAHYESGMFLCENPDDRILAHLRATKTMQEDAKLSLSLRAEAKNDSLSTTVSWGNNTDVTYSGRINAETFFHRAQLKAPLQAAVRIQPGEIIMNDTIWQLHESNIRIDSGKVAIDRFLFEHDDQRLEVSGALTEQVEDSLFVHLNKIKLEYVFDILQFHPVDFKGVATGRAYLSQLSAPEPQMKAKLFVENFTFNDGLMGDMNITGTWDAERGIHLQADIREKELSHTQVDGFVSPMDDALDLYITADHTNLYFLNYYLDGIFKEVSGRATGGVHLHGPFNELNLEGDAMMDEAKLDIEILNTAYELRNDSIKLRYNQILLDDVAIYDRDGNRGIINGRIYHDHLGDLSYNMQIDLNKFLVYNGKPNPESTFYGTVYGSGKATLVGDEDDLTVGLNLRTTDKTVFTYNSALPEELTSNEFITFVDHTPKREIDEAKYNYKNQTTEIQASEIPMDIRINVQVEATPEAEIRVIMDPIAGDYVMTRGTGTLRANYYNKGDFKMYGIYNLTYGLYKLSLQEVIRKEFQLTPGGTVSFNGNPAEGNLNLQAVYTINSASLNDLAPNAGFTQSSVRVNCLMNLTGQLFNPNIKFSLEIPTISDEEMELVHSYISTDEQMEMQIIYLLGIGRFYTYDYANNAGTDTEQSSAMNSLLSSTLSGQLNNMLSHIINSNNWNFGTNLSTGTRGWTDMEVEGILSSRLLNNRLLINGNFGYRENPLANTNFIGDFDVQWLLTPSGEISLKGYNQTNDRYFSKSTLTTQGIGLIWKKDFNSWFKRRKKK